CIISTAQQASPNVMGHSEPVFAQFRNLSALVVMNPSFIMPSRAIILPIQCRNAGMAAEPPYRAGNGSFPIECTLLPFVDEADRKNAEEDHDGPEANHADCAVCHCPGEQEGDFKVEHDEQ